MSAVANSHLNSTLLALDFFTFRSEPDIVDVGLTLQFHPLDLVGAEEMEEGLISRVFIDFEHPAILVTLKPHHERFLVVNAGSLPWAALHLLGDVLEDSPPADHVSFDVNQDVERLVQTLALVDHFKRSSAFLMIKILLRSHTYLYV